MKICSNPSIWTWVLLVFLSFGCQHSPEKLPQLKKAFKAQIDTFEKQKERANKHVSNGLKEMSVLQEVLQNAENTDKEFNRVYGKWKKVNNKVEKLYKEYEDLRKKADALFDALERQIGSLKDENNKRDLSVALQKSREKYSETLKNTEASIGKLRKLHGEAIDQVKALEAAVAIGQLDDISTGMKNIQGRVNEVMEELNTSISESKSLYESQMGKL